MGNWTNYWHWPGTGQLSQAEKLITLVKKWCLGMELTPEVRCKRPQGLGPPAWSTFTPSSKASFWHLILTQIYALDAEHLFTDSDSKILLNTHNNQLLQTKAWTNWHQWCMRTPQFVILRLTFTSRFDRPAAGLVANHRTLWLYQATSTGKDCFTNSIGVNRLLTIVPAWPDLKR